MITEQIIRTLIADAVRGVDVSAITNEADFVEHGLDSLDIATILMAVDEQLKIKIPDADIEQCASIQGLIEYCNRQPETA